MKFATSTLTNIIKHISRSPNQESYGLLCGMVSHDPTITKVIALQNSSKDDATFELRHDELVSYGQWANQQGLEIHAIYHSHPSGDLEPSFNDIRFMGSIKMPLVIFTLKNEQLTWVEISPQKNSAIRHSYAV